MGNNSYICLSFLLLVPFTCCYDNYCKAESLFILSSTNDLLGFEIRPLLHILIVLPSKHGFRNYIICSFYALLSEVSQVLHSDHNSVSRRIKKNRCCCNTGTIFVLINASVQFVTEMRNKEADMRIVPVGSSGINEAVYIRQDNGA